METTNKADIYEPMNPRLRSILIGLGLVTIVGIGIFFAPRVLGLYYQTRGGQLLEGIFSSSSSLNGGIACERPPLENDDIRLKLTGVIVDLQKATQYNSNNAVSYLQLGRAHCLLGENTKAIKAYQNFVGLRPENPLGHLELGFAYEAECRIESTVDNYADLRRKICPNDDQTSIILREWKIANANSDDFFLAGEQLRNMGRYLEALKWYQRAISMKPDWSDPWFSISLAFAELTKWEDAIQALQLAIDLKHDLSNLSTVEIEEFGNQAFIRRQYLEAYVWLLNRLNRTKTPEFDLLFRIAITATLSGYNKEASSKFDEIDNFDNTFEVYELKNTVRIKGNNLRRILSTYDLIVPNGGPLPNGQTDFSGILCCSGRALGVISVDQDAPVILRALVRNRPPAPIGLGLGIDGQALAISELEKEDNSWELLETTINLEEGLHTIDIWFFNDDVVNGLERDLEIAWLEVVRLR